MTDSLTKGGNTAWPHPRAAVDVVRPARRGERAGVPGRRATARSAATRTSCSSTTRRSPGSRSAGHRAEHSTSAAVPSTWTRWSSPPSRTTTIQSIVLPTAGGHGAARTCRSPVTGLTSERAVVLVEMYRRAGQWKLRNVSAGWTEGFAAWSARTASRSTRKVRRPSRNPTRHPRRRRPLAAPAINLRKPGVDAIDLGTRTGAINLRKGEQVTITKTPRIVATCTWPRATDYDIFALVRTGTAAPRRSRRSAPTSTRTTSGRPPRTARSGTAATSGGRRRRARAGARKPPGDPRSARRPSRST